MINDRKLQATLLNRTAERLQRDSFRNLILEIFTITLLSAWSRFLREFQWKRIFGSLLISNSISFLGWGVERLWNATRSPIFGNPFSGFAYSPRMPFWYPGCARYSCKGSFHGRSKEWIWDPNTTLVYDVPFSNKNHSK